MMMCQLFSWSFPVVFIVVTCMIPLACSDKPDPANNARPPRADVRGQENSVEQSVGFTSTDARPAQAREHEIRELTARYVLFSQKEPTLDNLLLSLGVKEARGEEVVEVTVALQLIAIQDITERNLAQKILNCYAANAGNWTIRSTCAKALLNVSKKDGIELSRVILFDAQATFEAKLLTSIYLVEAGELVGYGVLRQGLDSKEVVERSLAQTLLELFRKYDGVTITATGETIDIKQLLAETNN